MAIVSFWSNGREETGKTSAIVAMSTLLGVNHNYKILVFDTKYNDYTYEDCYWKEDKLIKAINSDDAKTDIGHGVAGLAQAIMSNKTSPEIVTNYTRIVFKERLELLVDTKIEPEDYERHKTIFSDIARIANKYYDLVFVDIDKDLDEKTTNSILEVSDLIVFCMPQKLRKINDFIELREEHPILRKKAVLPLLGKYDKNSKYNAKNVARYLKEKKGICAIPYNTLFMEACNDGQVDEFFIKFRKIKEKDKNAFFINEVRAGIEKIIEKLKELQMRM